MACNYHTKYDNLGESDVEGGEEFMGPGKDNDCHLSDAELAKLFGFDPNVTDKQVATSEEHELVVHGEQERRRRIENQAMELFSFLSLMP